MSSWVLDAAEPLVMITMAEVMLGSAESSFVRVDRKKPRDMETAMATATATASRVELLNASKVLHLMRLVEWTFPSVDEILNMPMVSLEMVRSTSAAVMECTRLEQVMMNTEMNMRRLDMKMRGEMFGGMRCCDMEHPFDPMVVHSVTLNKKPVVVGFCRHRWTNVLAMLAHVRRDLLMVTVLRYARNMIRWVMREPRASIEHVMESLSTMVMQEGQRFQHNVNHCIHPMSHLDQVKYPALSALFERLQTDYTLYDWPTLLSPM